MEDGENLPPLQSSEWESEGKFQHEWKQGFKDSIQIENRIRILELQKQRKIKDIEKKLNAHKKNVQLKIIKHQRQQDVENLHEKQKMNVTEYFTRFQSEKKRRMANIRSLRFDVLRTKNKEFWTVKKEREEINRKINKEKMLDREQKIEKRNKVRLMEIEAKENVVSSWNRRISQMKQSRQRLIDKKLREHEQNLLGIAKMAKKERKILQQIYKAEDMEKELGDMIGNESKMTGEELAQLYTTAL